jgi:hypothetical protein
MVAGPCHTALYKEGGGRRLASRGSPPATHPTYIPNSIYRERNSDGKLRCHRHYVDCRCPSVDLHSASLPKRRSPTWLADPTAPLPEMVTHTLSHFSVTPVRVHHIWIHTQSQFLLRLDGHLDDPRNLSYIIGYESFNFHFKKALL